MLDLVLKGVFQCRIGKMSAKYSHLKRALFTSRLDNHVLKFLLRKSWVSFLGFSLYFEITNAKLFLTVTEFKFVQLGF